jgi:hypothetical protein
MFPEMLTSDDDGPAINISIVRIMGFSSRKLHMRFTKRAVAWAFNHNCPAVQGAFSCGYEDSLTCRWLSELSGDKYHTVVN